MSGVVNAPMLQCTVKVNMPRHDMMPVTMDSLTPPSLNWQPLADIDDGLAHRKPHEKIIQPQLRVESRWKRVPLPLLQWQFCMWMVVWLKWTAEADPWKNLT